MLRLFLFVKAEAATIARFDKSLSNRLVKLFAETVVAQTFDTYFALQNYKDQYFEAAFSLDLEFCMLWLSRFVDDTLLEKAKRIRTLTLAALENVNVGGGEYVKALKSYLRGCKLKFATIAPL